MSNEVQLKSDNALGTVPIDAAELEADAKLGGQLTLQDISVPYLYILQGLSPQVAPDSDKYIEGAKPGMLYISNLELVFDGRDKGLIVVPCFYERLVTEWLPRENGGGLVASHAPESEALNKALPPNQKNQIFLPNGHQLIDTAYHYMLVQNPDTTQWTQVIVPFKSTALKASRRMNSIINSTRVPGTKHQAPRWLYQWLFKTKKEQKDQYIWSSPVLEQLDIVTAEVYAAAKQYAIISSKGLLRRAAVESEMEITTKTIREIDDEVPF